MHLVCQLLRSTSKLSVSRCSLQADVHRIYFAINGRTKYVGNTQPARIIGGFLLVTMSASFAVAQSDDRGLRPLVRSDWSRLPISKVGEPISSQFVDSFMTTDQADRIREFLCEPSVFTWDGDTTLVDIQHDLARYLPAGLDLRALEDVGLTGDTVPIPEPRPQKLNSAALTSDPLVDADPLGDSDPFGEPSTAVERDAVTPSSDSNVREEHIIRHGGETAGQEVPDSKASLQSSPAKWWQTERPQRRRRSVVTNGGKLFEFLSRVDLTLNLEHGVLKITTVEQAENACCIRVYDVTSLVPPSDRSFAGENSSYGSLDTSYVELDLNELIEMSVEPDTWESLGGPSTVARFRTATRRWLVVRAPLLVQLKVHSLLNRLNQ
jgi:hypothetical protein